MAMLGRENRRRSERSFSSPPEVESLEPEDEEKPRRLRSSAEERATARPSPPEGEAEAKWRHRGSRRREEKG
jgi:hypothetical protein